MPNLPNRKSRSVTFLNPHPRTRSIRLPVELADDLWRIDLLGGVPRYPRVQRNRKRKTQRKTRERDRGTSDRASSLYVRDLPEFQRLRPGLRFDNLYARGPWLVLVLCIWISVGCSIYTMLHYTTSLRIAFNVRSDRSMYDVIP